jgi:hypothetical protein
LWGSRPACHTIRSAGSKVSYLIRNHLRARSSGTPPSHRHTVWCGWARPAPGAKPQRLISLTASSASKPHLSQSLLWERSLKASSGTTQGCTHLGHRHTIWCGWAPAHRSFKGARCTAPPAAKRPNGLDSDALSRRTIPVMRARASRGSLSLSLTLSLSLSLSLSLFLSLSLPQDHPRSARARAPP